MVMMMMVTLSVFSIAWFQTFFSRLKTQYMSIILNINFILYVKDNVYVCNTSYELHYIFSVF